ncbi:MAG: hypothetical protein C4551_07850 [Bacillota bacterium]|nr:MAG: hypothetical protein C4551_07850 [Bacillota bacterium]
MSRKDSGKRTTAWTALALLVAVVVAAGAFAGCLNPAGRPSGDTGQAPGAGSGGAGGGTDGGTGGGSGGGNQVTLVLYFPDSQALYLEREERVVEASGDETYEELAITALIEGPRVEGHGRVIPEGAELLSVTIEDGVAYVDFSSEFKDNHWGGSCGELMTVFSIVNTLTESGSITGVKILIEGEEVETLAGHLELSMVFERNEDMIAGGN